MSTNLKIVFAGTPEIASTVLSNLIDSGFKIDLVLTKVDRPKGRGQKITMSPVKELSLLHNIPLLQPLSFKNDNLAIESIRELNPDIMIVIAYGLIIPEQLLNIPKYGCVNIHVSLLPRHRGAAPIQRSILEGDTTTGVTIMQMDSGLDTGDILLQQEIAIFPTDTAGTLHDKLAILGSKMIIQYLNNIDDIVKTPQDSSRATYAHKIEKAEALLDWSLDATLLSQKIRGFNPHPGCFTYLDGKLIKIWLSEVTNTISNKSPGTIVKADKNGIYVSCGNSSVILLKELQDAGKSRQLASQYIQGHTALEGKVFDPNI
jgi:methionyl-tRNA formyltransferase